MLDQEEHSAETRQRRRVVKGRTPLESKIGKSAQQEEKKNTTKKDQPNHTVPVSKKNNESS